MKKILTLILVTITLISNAQINYYIPGDSLISPGASFNGVVTHSGNRVVDVGAAADTADVMPMWQIQNSINAINYWTKTLNYIHPLTPTDSVVIGGTTAYAPLTVNGRIDIRGIGGSVFIGEDAGLNDDLSSNNNTAIGRYALCANTSGINNTATGSGALLSTTTGKDNTAIGYTAIYYNTTGSCNTAMGSKALFNNTTGLYNTVLGHTVCSSNTTGSYNTALGKDALSSNTTGSYNTALGMQSGRKIADGVTSNQISNNSVYLGYDTKALANGETNEIVIGSNAIGNGSNTATLGDDNVTDVYLNENGTAKLHASTLAQSGLILPGSDSLVDADAVYSAANSIWTINSNTINPASTSYDFGLQNYPMVAVSTIDLHVTGADDVLVTSGAVKDYVDSSRLQKVDATNLSDVLFITGGDTVEASFGHVHTEYALQGSLDSLESKVNGLSGTGTVTSIATTAPITGGTITSSGTIGISKATTSTDGYLSGVDYTTFNNKWEQSDFALSYLKMTTSQTISLSGIFQEIDTYDDSVNVNLTGYATTGVIKLRTRSNSIYDVTVTGMATITGESSPRYITFELYNKTTSTSMGQYVWDVGTDITKIGRSFTIPFKDDTANDYVIRVKADASTSITITGLYFEIKQIY